MQDDVPVWMLLNDLRSIKLSRPDREFILSAAKKGGSALHLDDKVRVKKIARKHTAALAGLRKARESARHSVAKESRGLTSDGVTERQRKRHEATSGFGF